MNFDADDFLLFGLYGTAASIGGQGTEQVRQEAARDNALLTREVEQLEARLDRLQLACRAMSEIITEQLQLPPEAIVERIQEIDERIRNQETATVACPACSRLSRASRRTCMYCGEPMPSAASTDDTN